MEGSEEGAAAQVEVVLAARQSAVGDVVVPASVEQVVGGERQAQTVSYLPGGGEVEEDEVAAVAFGKAGEVVFGCGGQLESVVGDDGCREPLDERVACVRVTCNSEARVSIGRFVVHRQPFGDAAFEIRLGGQ